MTSWPITNELAWLQIGCCTSAHPTRIEDYDGDYCVIGGPIPLHHGPVSPPDDTFILGWANGRGNFEQPVRLVKAEERPLLLWTVAADGEGQIVQRRMYYRVETDIPVQLKLMSTGTPIKGEARDISEGGLRCVVDEFTLNPGSRTFEVSFNLNNERYTLLAHAVRWGEADEKQRQVGIQFIDAPRATLDAIRAYVFQMQIRNRK